MDDLLVSDRELAEEVSNHFRLDLDSNKFLSRVQVQGQTQHLRYYDHIPRVRLDRYSFSPAISVFSSRLANMLSQASLVIGQAFDYRPPLTGRKERAGL